MTNRITQWAEKENLLPEFQSGFRKQRSKLGLGFKVIKILKDFYAKATVSVQNNGRGSIPVKVTKGVLQGEVSSPLLFALFTADLEEFLKSEGVRGVTNGSRHRDYFTCLCGRHCARV